jgi:Tol biopolymer transport system component
MGEVYRARDTKLDRDVALKILPTSFASDPDRLMRFEREAKALAALNHPNIAGIYEMAAGLDGTSSVLVMELVEGEDLSTIIARGPLPVEEALAIARQIVNALEAAHERGIIHRDLKPANVKVRADGSVKVLDFGLAKLTGPADHATSGLHDPASSPTMTSPALTAMGLILGTAAYMSPEQAKGRPIDRRADVWAFGVVLFEMLTGRRAFEGAEVTEVLASVLKDTPALETLPGATPPAIRRLLRRCLEKNPANRLDSTAAARLEIEEALRDPGGLPVMAPPAVSRALPWSLAALAALAALVAVVAGVMAWRTPAPPAARVSISLPAGHQVTSGPIITRDGMRIVFASGSGIGEPRLYLRTLDSFELKELPGTEGADRPFFSPDGRWVAFFAKGRLFKLDLEGGVPTPLADAPSPGGGTWAEDDTIVFAPTWNGGLYRVMAGGSSRDLLIKPDPAKKEYAYASPRFLPGGRTLLFAVWGAAFNIERLTLEDLHREVVVPGAWTNTVDTTSGHLLLGSNEGDVKAFVYPSAAAAGSGITVLEGVHWMGGSGDGLFKMAVSDDGTLVYAPGDITQRSLVIVDETGRAEPLPGEPQIYLSAEVSPDGKQAATEQGGKLWLVDLERGGRTPIASGHRGGAKVWPVWDRDGARVFFASNVEGNWDIYAVNAARPDVVETVLTREFDQFPTSIAPDGTLAFAELRPGEGMDIWLLPPGGAPVAWLATPAEEEKATFSPDGSLVAYASNASGRFEVFVRARVGSAAGVQVSTNGGAEPVWARAGNRVLFREGNAVMAATVRAGSGVPVGRPQLLFDRGWELPAGVGLSVFPDRERFLMIQFAPAAIPTRLNVIFNWFDELRARVK